MPWQSIVIDWLYSLDYWHWLILGLVLVTLEMMVNSAYFLWSGIAAMIMAGLLYILPDLSLLLQVFIFITLTTISIQVYRVYRDRHPTITDQPTLNRKCEQYIGRQLILTEAIINNSGKIKINDTIWKISGADQVKGSSVRVVAVEGAILMVESMPERLSSTG